MAPICSRIASVSEDGDTVCPLCAEEMDLTDQQLKPCKCGYEMCVWCWHHIMEMAEKDKTEGRCPACRTTYDKERIVGMAVNCERLVAEMNGGRRQRSQKGKTKVSAEARKHLSTVRVVQRNLVYIVGLPAELCDESLLERKEYFGQYGEILKVSISRSVSTTNQQASSSNNVYITYAREEDAVKCIQAVHNYLLDGKRLRACFGTTKYCHAWLRYMSCNNRDCLYLHDIGSQEDSFNKDEIVSAHTRSGISLVSSCNLQRRAGSLLPPAEDCCNLQTVSDKHSVNNVSKTTEGQGLVLNVSAGRLANLPAASSWGGSRGSNGLSLPTSTICSQSSIKQKVESKNHSYTHSSITMGAKEMSSAWHDDDMIASITEGHGSPFPPEPSKNFPGEVSQITTSDLPSVSLHFDAHCFGDSAWDDDSVIASAHVEESFTLQLPSSSTAMKLEKSSTVDGECQTSGVGLANSVPDKASYSLSEVCPAGPISPVFEGKDNIYSSSGKKIDVMTLMGEENLNKQSCSSGAVGPTNLNQRAPDIDESEQNALQRHEKDVFDGSSTRKCQLLPTKEQYDSEGIGNTASLLSLEVPSCFTSSRNLELPKMGLESTIDVDDDSSLDVADITLVNSADTIQRSCSSRFNHSLSNCNHQPCSSSNELDKTVNSSAGQSIFHTNAVVNHASPSVGNKVNLRNMNKPESSFDSSVISFNGGIRFLDTFNDLGKSDNDASVHTKESSIITDILSLDFDPWNDSMSLSNELYGVLCENEDRNGSAMLSKSRISQNKNQSRFSFARQDNQVKSVESSIRDIKHMSKDVILKDSRANDFQNALMSNDSNGLCSTLSSDRHAGVQRIKISAPPGFSVPSRATPPGFSNQDHQDQNFMATVPENHLHGNALFRNQYEVRPTKNSIDVELIDPAILAVGKGHMPLVTSSISNFGFSSAFPERFRSEGDLMNGLLMKRSTHQNMRVSDSLMENFFPLNESYSPSYIFPQNHSTLSPLAQLSLQQPRNSQISSAHWDSWNSKQSNSAMSLTDNMKNESFGLDNPYIGKAEYRFHIPSSGHIYNRAFGI